MASIAMSTTTEEGGASGLSWTWRLFSCSGSKTSCQASSPSSGRQATTESPAEAPCSPEETSSSLTESAELESWGTSSPKSPLDVNFGRRRKGTDEHGKERSLSRSEDDDVQWLKAESNKTLAMLELAAHGTIDLTLDVPEIRDEPEFTCERFLRGFQYNRAKSLKNLEGYVMWRSNTSKVEEADIKESLRARKVFLLQDRDRRGGPVCVILARNHDRFRTTVEETVKLLTYSLDRTIGTMDPSLGATQATVLLDLDGLGWRSLDVEALKHVSWRGRGGKMAFRKDLLTLLLLFFSNPPRSCSSSRTTSRRGYPPRSSGRRRGEATHHACANFPPAPRLTLFLSLSACSFPPRLGFSARSGRW